MPQAYYQDLSITIELEDMNDNAPVFVSDIINIEINENTRSAYSLDNQMAYDPDIGKISKKLNFLSKCQKYSKRVKNTEDTSQMVIHSSDTKLYFLYLISQKMSQ